MKKKKYETVTVQQILEFDRDAKNPPRGIMDKMFKKIVSPEINKFYSLNGHIVNKLREQGDEILKEYFEFNDDGSPKIEVVKTPVEGTKVISLKDRVLGTKQEQEFKEENLPKMKEGKLREDAQTVLKAFHSQVVQIEV